MKPVWIKSVILSGCFVISQAVMAADINAVLDWSDARNLGTSVSARVEQVMVKPGMQVSKDSPLVELDSRYFENRKNRATASVRAAKLVLDEARLEQERAIELYERTVLSQFDRRKADRELAAAESVYSSALAELRDARLDLEYSRLLAPFDAVILGVNTAPGEVVLNQLEAEPLIRLARAGEMRAIALVSGEQLRGVALGQSIEVAFRGNWLQGQVDAIEMDPVKTGEAPLYQLAVRFAVDPAGFARAGEPSAIRLP